MPFPSGTLARGGLRLVEQSAGLPAARCGSPLQVNLPLEPQMVHVWRARIADFSDLARQLIHLLSESELQRSRRYESSIARTAFIVRRSLLRLLLSAYTNVRPSSLLLRTDPAGKPRLEGPNLGRPIRFSVSSSGDLVLMAFSADREVGVDVETVRPTDWAGLARWFLPDEEIARLEAMAPAERQERFFRLWSRMEACVKATGSGISGELKKNRMVHAPWCASDGAPVGGLAVRDIRPAPEYRGAVAAPGADWQVRVFRLPIEIVSAAGCALPRGPRSRLLSTH